MAEPVRDGDREQDPPFTIRALWRLASWGGAAAASLLVVVLAGYSHTGSQRPMAARASPDPVQEPSAAALARALDIETQRLAESVRALTTDRDRLAARIGELERGLDDVTGSIRRQAAAPPAVPVAEPPLSATRVPALPPAAASPPPNEAAALAREIAARQPSAPVEVQGGAGGQAVFPAVVAESSLQPPVARAEHAVELGGATSFEGVRTLWATIRNAHGDLFEGLDPMVKVGPNRKKAVELRLIAGPLTEEAAEHLCATLTGARRFCRPVAFEGERLADAQLAPERKRAQTNRSPPAPAAAPAPAPRSIFSITRP